MDMSSIVMKYVSNSMCRDPNFLIDETGSSRLRLPGRDNHPGRPRFGGRAWQESQDGGPCLMISDDELLIRFSCHP